MKKILFFVNLFVGYITLHSQTPTPIYSFSFDNSLSADIGSGTFSGGSVSWNKDRYGNLNSALEINKDNAPISVNLPNLPQSYNNRTISFWVKFSTMTPGQGESLIQYGGTGNFFTVEHLLSQYGQANGISDLNVYLNGGVYYYSSTWKANAWQHVAIKFNGSNVLYYLNGKLAMTASPDTSYSATSGTQLTVGGSLLASGISKNSFLMDDLNIYNTTLTDTQIEDLFVLGSQTNSYPTNGLVAYYSFDNKLTSEVNTSSLNLVPTSGNSYNSYVSGKVGNAASFNGLTPGVYNNNFWSFLTNDEFSICFWEKSSTQLQNRYATAFELFETSFFRFNSASAPYYNDYGYQGSNGTWYTQSNFRLTDNTFRHIAIVHKAQGTEYINFKLYIDGVDYGDISVSTALSLYNAGRSSLYIGTGANNTLENQQKRYRGVIDEFFVYNRALTQQEIIQIKNFRPENTLSNSETHESLLKIYPNPVSNVLNISTQQDIKIIEIYTASGQMIEKTLYKAINTTSYQKGEYIIKIIFKSGKTAVEKFIKK